MKTSFIVIQILKSSGQGFIKKITRCEYLNFFNLSRHMLLEKQNIIFLATRFPYDIIFSSVDIFK